MMSRSVAGFGRWETITGNDGEIQGAVIKVCQKGGKCKLMRRSIQHLYQLEVGSRVIANKKALCTTGPVNGPEENEMCNRSSTGDEMGSVITEELHREPTADDPQARTNHDSD